jgi:hypothetical protein
MSRRLTLSLALASLLLAIGVPVEGSAASTSVTVRGVVGRYVMPDSRSSPGAYCTYDGGRPRRRVFVPVRMPRIYWPDLRSGVTDSGRVGWQIRLQMSSDRNGPWRTNYRSSITIDRATENRAADVFKLGINWRIGGRVYWRVRVRMFWFRSNGSVMGSVTRTVHWYQLARAESPWSPGSPGSWNIGATYAVRHNACPNLLRR